MRDEHDGDATAGAAGRRPTGPRLSRVEGPLGPVEPPPSVRLCREWKGLTVADLLRDEVVDRLPGQVRSALRHIDRGDFAAADRVMPGHHAPVLAGPGHRHRSRKWLLAAATLLAVVLAAMVASMFR